MNCEFNIKEFNTKELNIKEFNIQMKPTLHTIVLIAAALAIALLADAWRSARQDSAQLAATLSTQNAVLQQSAAAEKQRDTQLASALATIAAQKRAVQTPIQAADALPNLFTELVPQLPLPISLNLPDLTHPTTPSTPAPPATLAIPTPDLKPIYDALQDCRSNTLDTDALKKDLADQKAQSTALQRERDTAVSAARGGTFLLRLKREAKWFAIGIVAGAATMAVLHH